jgi:hypothetical protein
MPVDPALSVLATVIESGHPWPRPTCPQCGTGYIGFAAPASDESHETAQLHGHDYFDPDWIKGTFVVRGQCENSDCRSAVYGTGDFHVDLSSDQDFESRGPDYSEYFKLIHLHPAIRIMSVPKSAPDEVREGVLRGSRVLFADPGLAATALRATVERFLTTAGIPGRTTTGSFIPADTRIQQWAAQDPTRETTAHLFLAVKWLGNAGTHEDADLTTTEVLQGASVLDEAFHRIYTGPDIDAHARNINAAKGPHRQP